MSVRCADGDEAAALPALATTFPRGDQILDHAAPGRRLTLAADPVRWARKSHKSFRADYVVPVFTEDTLPADGES